ncbi:MAG: glycosyltransferase family 4 protein [Planctomycetota bacterium]|jgi:glycogen(starch) synthase|nr:glycosyltransferase family 4 protein [Planctomycetota bacterium]
MRICLITPEFPERGPSFGIGTYVSALRSGLIQAGDQVLTVVANHLGIDYLDHNGDWSHTPPTAGPACLRAALLPRRATDRIEKFDPDIVESSNWHGLGAFLRGSGKRIVRLSTPARIEARWASGKARLTLPVFHSWEKTAVISAHVLIADSSAMDSVGESIYGRRADFIIPHGLAPQAPQQTEARNTPNLNLLSVGRCEARKGTDLLLAAWPHIRKQHPTASLHIVGKDPHGWALRMSQIDSSICYHGVIPNTALSELRSRCCIQIVPSRFESFGLVVLEAWANGLPVIACTGGALPEVIGTAGVICQPNASSLAHSVGKLLSSQTTQQRLARDGEQRLQQRFSLTQWIDHNRHCYRQAVRNAR